MMCAIATSSRIYNRMGCVFSCVYTAIDKPIPNREQSFKSSFTHLCKVQERTCIYVVCFIASWFHVVMKVGECTCVISSNAVTHITGHMVTCMHTLKSSYQRVINLIFT